MKLKALRILTVSMTNSLNPLTRPIATPMSSCQFLGNLGNVSFVLTALIGGLFALNGIGGLTIGGLMAFLQLNRSFTGPIAQVSQQLNFVLMALAGGDRVFDLLDEEEEVDLGKKSRWSIMNWSMEKWLKPIRKLTSGLETPSSKWKLPACQDGRKCGL